MSHMTICEESNLKAPRSDWTKFCGHDRNLTFVGAVLSINTSDESLFNLLVAMKRYGCLSLEKLAKMDLEELQFFVRCTGYNHWSRNPAYVIGACMCALKNNGGRCPTDPFALLSLLGVGRKVFALIWAHALGKKGECIAVDSHLMAVFPFLKWCDADKDTTMAREVEDWLPPKYFELVNEVFCGMRQLWRTGENTREQMRLIASQLEEKNGCVGFQEKLVGLCKALPPKKLTKLTKQQRNKLEEDSLAASMAAWQSQVAK